MALYTHNNISTPSSLASGITNVALSFTVQTGHGATYPSGRQKVLIEDEIVDVSSRTGDVFTIISGGRGYGGTTAVSHLADARVDLVVTSEDYVALLDSAGGFYVQDVLDLNSEILRNPADPTLGVHVGDRDYNDARYTLASGGPFLPLAGGVMTGGIQLGGFSMTGLGPILRGTIATDLSIQHGGAGTSPNNHRMTLVTGGDIQFLSGGGSETFLWDQSDSRWEFLTQATVTTEGAGLALFGTTSSFINFHRTGGSVTGQVGNLFTGGDTTYLAGVEHVLIRSGLSDFVRIENTDAGSTIRTRQVWDAAGDITFYDAVGSAVGLWDESEDGWRFQNVNQPVVDTDSIPAIYAKERAGTNLWYNGSGMVGDNTNFPGMTFNGAYGFVGRGGFTSATFTGSINASEFIAINPEWTYETSGWVKHVVNVGQRQYLKLSQYDVNQLSISPWMGDPSLQRISSQTTLAVAFTPGDATMTLTDGSGWDGTLSFRSVNFYPYTNSFGYTYPDYEYTRHAILDNFTISGNTLTPASSASFPANPNNGGTWPIGTPVMQSRSGGSFIYPWSDIINDTDWRYVSGRTSVWWYGTSFVKPGFLTNYTIAGGEVAWSGVRFEALVSEAIGYLKLDGSNQMLGNLNMGTTNDSFDVVWTNATQPMLLMDSRNDGDNWTSQGALIAIGEGAADNSNLSMKMTYRGDGYGFIGMGRTDGVGITGAGQPEKSSIRFNWNVEDITLWRGNTIAQTWSQDGDIVFWNDAASATTLLWDESDNRWELSRNLRFEAGDLDMNNRFIIAPLDPTLGTHVGDRDYNDARYIPTSDYTDFVNVTGDNMTGGLTITTDGNAINLIAATGTGNPHLIQRTDNYAGWIIQRADATRVYAWEKQPDDGVVMVMYDATGANARTFADLNYGGTNLWSSTTEESRFRGSSIGLDTSAGNRVWINSNTDIEFKKGNGSTVSLFWDQSEDDWQFVADVDLGGYLLSAPADPTLGTHVGDRDYNDARYFTPYKAQRALPTVVGNYVEAFSVTRDSGAHSLYITAVVSDSGNSISKTYAVTSVWNISPGVWLRLQPLTDSGPWGGTQNFDVEMEQTNNLLRVRVVRTLGTVAGNITLHVWHGDHQNAATFASISGTGTGSAGSTSTRSQVDHGGLTGLGDDDHTIYHTDARAVTWIGTRDLSDVGDVTLTSIASGELLKWNGTIWINNTLAEAGISGTGHTHSEYFPTDGATPFGGTLNLNSNTITGVPVIRPAFGTDIAIQDGDWVNRIKIWDATNDGDITFYKADGTTSSSRWDESLDRWSISTDFIMSGTNVLHIVGASRLETDQIWPTAAGNWLTLRDGAGETRFAIASAASGDMYFYDPLGAVLLRWSESSDVWQFDKPILITTSSELRLSASQAGDYWDIGGGYYLSLYQWDSSSASQRELAYWASYHDGTGNDGDFRLSSTANFVLLWYDYSAQIMYQYRATQFSSTATFGGAASATGSQALTTKQFRNIYVASTAPGTPLTGDVWIDTT